MRVKHLARGSVFKSGVLSFFFLLRLFDVPPLIGLASRRHVVFVV